MSPGGNSKESTSNKCLTEAVRTMDGCALKNQQVPDDELLVAVQKEDNKMRLDVINITASSNTNSSVISRSDSRTSSNSDDKILSLNELEISDDVNKSGVNTLKKRFSSSRTPTRKAKRIRFYRNGDRFYQGIVIPVSYERYRSFDSLIEDLTKLLEDNVKLPGAVRNIYSLNGKKVTSIDELEDGKNYVCSCNAEVFKKIEYSPVNTIVQQQKANSRLSRNFRPSSPLKSVSNGNSPVINLAERDNVVYPRIVTLIRNGTKPRRILRLLLNKRNSPSYDHVLTAITQCVKLDTGCVRKVFTISGTPVLSLADFFTKEDIFFTYGTERVLPDDFKLETEEQKSINNINARKQVKNDIIQNGKKPAMPNKTHNLHNITFDAIADDYIGDTDLTVNDLPNEVQKNYELGPIIGDGNFAIVLKLTHKKTKENKALKIIDKSKCKGKEHYIAAEVRVMKKLQHPYIISLFFDIDTEKNTFLLLEYISGGDLFDAITRVTRFAEEQAQIMVYHLASAMSYLHSMQIVHRDIKPENLLVRLDYDNRVTVLKLADFGLACEVTEPLFSVCGTPTYVAPEILMETGYGLKIDVWAAGIILYILLCGFPPFVSPDNEQEPLFDAILSGVYEFPEPYWSDIGDGVRDLISNMLQSDPDLRFASEDILDHPWTMGKCEFGLRTNTMDDQVQYNLYDEV